MVDSPYSFDLEAPLKDAVTTVWSEPKPLMDGFDCPCCSQLIKIYRRPLYGAMAVALIKLYRAGGDRDYVHLPSITRVGGDAAKLVHWELIEAEQGKRADGSKRTGYWRVTSGGVEFIHGRLKVPGHIYLFNQKFFGFDHSALVDIYEALGEKFNYNQLMES